MEGIIIVIIESELLHIYLLYRETKFCASRFIHKNEIFCVLVSLWLFCTEQTFCFIIELNISFMQNLLLSHLGFVSAGFPSPAEDYEENPIDLHTYLIRNKPSTFFVRVEGTAMQESHICAGDLLVIDTSLLPVHESIVVACIDGELLVRHFVLEHGKKFLRADNVQIPHIQIDETEFSLFGVVTGVIRKI